MTTSIRPTLKAVEPEWRDYANCRTFDPDLFFPTGSDGQAKAQEEDAKRVCGGCVVRAQCLDWAVRTRQYVGVWGGQSEKERQGLYETPERSFTRCLNAQAWIEEQLAVGRGQKTVARELGVDPGVLCRAVKQMRLEREALAAADQDATVVEGAAA